MPLPQTPIPHWDLGKYATFVDAAYAVSALVLTAMVLQTLAQARRWRRAAERRPSATAPFRKAADVSRDPP